MLVLWGIHRGQNMVLSSDDSLEDIVHSFENLCQDSHPGKRFAPLYLAGKKTLVLCFAENDRL